MAVSEAVVVIGTTVDVLIVLVENVRVVEASTGIVVSVMVVLKVVVVLDWGGGEAVIVKTLEAVTTDVEVWKTSTSLAQATCVG